MSIETKLIHGDCAKELKNLAENSIDLIVTSPLMRTKGRARMVEFIQMNTWAGFCQFQKN